MSVRNTKEQSGPDWDRLDKMSDTDIDFSDIPELDDDFFTNAALRMPRDKKQVSIRLDGDVLAWFKHQSRNYQRRINDSVDLVQFCPSLKIELQDANTTASNYILQLQRPLKKAIKSTGSSMLFFGCSWKHTNMRPIRSIFR